LTSGERMSWYRAGTNGHTGGVVPAVVAMGHLGAAYSQRGRQDSMLQPLEADSVTMLLGTVTVVEL